MVRLARIFGVALLVASSLAASTGTAATPKTATTTAASRILDRTVVCHMAGAGYPDPVRYMDVQASPRLRGDGPGAFVANGPSGGASADGVSAGFFTRAFFGQPAGLWLNRTRCTASRLRVSLSSTGLRGGQTRFGDRYRCDIPAGVLIRVRAVFKRPVTLTRDPRATYRLFARGNIATGQLAVVTAQGSKPIAFASADDATGKAAIFVARSRCFLQ